MKVTSENKLAGETPTISFHYKTIKHEWFISQITVSSISWEDFNYIHEYLGATRIKYQELTFNADSFSSQDNTRISFSIFVHLNNFCTKRSLKRSLSPQITGILSVFFLQHTKVFGKLKMQIHFSRKYHNYKLIKDRISIPKINITSLKY